MLHIPVLRRGRPYRSLEVSRVVHHRSREPFVEVSQANAGLIRRDLRDQAAMRAALRGMSTSDLLERCRRAADLFATGTLSVGDEAQRPEDYVAQVSATTGLPHVLVRRLIQKVAGVLRAMPAVLDGLTRGLDIGVLDHGRGQAGGHAVSFTPRADALGVVLPSNSPGVHSLWVPAVALKMPLILKPGSAEPWTPYRLIQAFIGAGVPADAFGYYPADHAGAAEILRSCGRGIVFGDTSTTSAWADDPRVEVHGPGYSKVVLGPDASRDFQAHLDVIAASIVENSGRSCVNASGVWVTENARAIAHELAARMALIRPRAADDPDAQLAPFADPAVAERISAMIDAGLAEAGAEDVTARYRSGSRLVRSEGSTYLLPTIVLCASPDHPLANREFLFPFAAVVPVSPADLPDRLGPSLAVTAITEDAALVRRLLDSPLLHRLNLGPIPTPHVTFDQPHEGNLFEHLYARRALQQHDGARAAAASG
jgi:acyl-CoA reductase-like NAD-dependent aldehyde dehydrogenase